MMFPIFFSLAISLLITLGWYFEGRLGGNNWFLPLLFFLGELFGWLLMEIFGPERKKYWQRLRLPPDFGQEITRSLAPVLNSFSFQAVFYFFSLWLIISNETIFAHGMVLAINGYFLRAYYLKRKEEKALFFLAIFALVLLMFLVVG